MSETKCRVVAVVTLFAGFTFAGAAPQAKVEVAPAPREVPSPKTFTVSFVNAEWADVLDWFAEVSGLTPISSVQPKGKVTLKPPKDKKFTVGEIIDLLNESMIQQKFILIRRQVSFTILPTDEGINPFLIPRVELADLKDRGKTELVVVCFPIPPEALVGEEIVPEVERMLTPFGAVAGWKNILVIRDTAGNINRIYQTFASVMDDGPGDVLTHALKYKKAQDVAEQLKTLLADPKDGKNGRVASVAVTVDEKTNTVTVTAPPEKIALAKKFLEETDRPQPLFPRPPGNSDIELRKYPVAAGTTDAAVKAVQAASASVRVLGLPTNEVLVLASPAEHFLLAKLPILTPDTDGVKKP